MKSLAFIIPVAAGLAITTAHAATTATNPDLILGFQASNGTGKNINLEVDLGPATQFFGSGVYATTTGLQTLVHLGADLDAQYSPAGATRGSAGTWTVSGLVSFGIIGAEQSNFGTTAPDGLPKGTLYATKPETTAGTPSTPWTNNTQAAQKQTNSQISTLYDGYNTQGAAGIAPNALILSASASESYTTQENLQLNLEFNYFPLAPGIDHVIDFTKGAPVSDLYQLEPTNGTAPFNTVNLLGAFELSNSGDLIFSNNPSLFVAPEPSSAALLVSAASLLGFWRRRPARA